VLLQNRLAYLVHGLIKIHLVKGHLEATVVLLVGICCQQMLQMPLYLCCRGRFIVPASYTFAKYIATNSSPSSKPLPICFDE